MDIKQAIRALDGIVPKKNEKYQHVHFFGGNAYAFTPEIAAEINNVVGRTISASVNHARLDKALRRFESPSLEWAGSDLLVGEGAERYTLPVFSGRRMEWPVSVPTQIATVCRKTLEDLSMGMCTADETEVDQEPVVRLVADEGEIRLSSGTGLACSTAYAEAEIYLPYEANLPAGSLRGAVELLTCCGADSVKLSRLGSGLEMGWSGGRVHIQESYYSGFASGKQLTQVAGEAQNLGCSRDDLMEFFSASSYLVDKDSDTIVFDPMGSKMKLTFKSGFGKFEKTIPADATGEPFKASLSRMKIAVKGAAGDGFDLLKTSSAVLCRSGKFVAAIALSV
jgi:hypothetical protein